jgi:hypothetical protein
MFVAIRFPIPLQRLEQEKYYQQEATDGDKEFETGHPSGDLRKERPKLNSASCDPCNLLPSRM